MNRKMYPRYFLWFLLGCINSVVLTGQVITLNSNQAPPLSANAGSDITIKPGRSISLGGYPCATDGYGGYVYLWSPAAGLDNPTNPNPLATPTGTTTYLLTVTDSKNCSVQDDITVTIQATGIDETTSSVGFNVFPNPNGGLLAIEVNGAVGQTFLKIINSTGLVVYQLKQDAAPFLRTEVDTRPLPKGAYLVIAIVNGQVITKPIIVF
jgi:hypothetical protein